jgi:hypothetical protein
MRKERSICSAMLRGMMGSVSSTTSAVLVEEEAGGVLLTATVVVVVVGGEVVAGVLWEELIAGFGASDSWFMTTRI